jgi:hypothetical protein
MSDRIDNAIYRFTDVDGDKIAIFPATIPVDGKEVEGINIRTSPSGCSIPLSEIWDLISPLDDVAVRYFGRNG